MQQRQPGRNIPAGRATMTTAILTPDLKNESHEVRVSCWLVDVGDEVECGERVAELLMPGVTFDVAAPIAGTLHRISKPVDTVIQSGDILGWIANRPEDDPDDFAEPLI